jgi:MFS family permease
MYWLIPPFFLFALAVGGMIVPKLNLYLSLVCRGYFIEKSGNDPTFILPIVLGNDNPQCRIPEIQALTTKFALYITIITGALSAIMSPKLGALSDRYGRLKLLVISGIGAFLAEIITILAATYPDTIHYNWLLLGAVFDGLCGSFTAGMALTHAYAADCTAPPKRAVAFGYFHACLFSGIAVGPLIAAFLVSWTGSLLVIFYFALFIHAFFVTFILSVVPESLVKKRQLNAREKYNAETGAAYNESQPTWLTTLRQMNIFTPLGILFPTGPGSSGPLRANLILLSAVDTIIFGVAMGAMTVVVYYSGYMFEWNTAEISIFTSIVNVFRVSGLIIVMPLLNYLVRTRRANKQRRESGFAVAEPNTGSDSLDLWIIRAACVFEIIGYAGYASARTGGGFIVSGIMASLGAIGSPTLQSALTKHVPHDKIGQLLGATGLLHALARIVCPLIFNLIYAWTVGTFPQTVFVVLSACFGLGLICSWFIRPHSKLFSQDFHSIPFQTKEANDAIVYLEEEPVEVHGGRTSRNDEPDEDRYVDEEITAV